MRDPSAAAVALAVILSAAAFGEELVPYAPGGKRGKGGVGGGPACLAAGTPVLTPKGEVAIELLAAGDELFSVEERTGLFVLQRVAATRRREGLPTLRFRLDGVALLATSEHPLYDADARAYRPAGSFSAGRRLARAGPAGLLPARVASIEPGPEATVFDLVVDGAHRNFVAGGILVHNKGAGQIDPAVAAALKRKAQAAATAARREGLRLAPVAEILGKKPGLAGRRVAVMAVLHELHATAPSPACTLRGRKFDETLPAGLSRLGKDRRKRLLQVSGLGGDHLLLFKGVLRPDVPSGRPDELYLDVDAFQEVGALPPGFTDLPDASDVLR